MSSDIEKIFIPIPCTGNVVTLYTGYKEDTKVAKWAMTEKFPCATNYHGPLTYRKFVIYFKSFVKCGHDGYQGIANLNCQKVKVCTWNVFMQGTCKDIRGSEVT